MTDNKQAIKVAILDLYNGTANKAIGGFEKILEQYRLLKNVELAWEVFDVRKSNQLPDTSFDIYISSGGPGNPYSEAEEWDKNYFKLVDELFEHNASPEKPKKHVLFVCHSFQLMCRQYKLGEVSLRNISSFGVVKVDFVHGGNEDVMFKGLSDPFYAVDSRSWQVINPDIDAFKKMGASLLAIERDRGDDLPRGLMAIRFSDYFIATQFHPEVAPDIMQIRLLMDDNKRDVIAEYGEGGYRLMLDEVYDEGKLMHAYNTIIPNFLNEAINHARGI
ncbi:type 1 glutamine amidotransferase [Mucilaginibacter agri]|uniref:GMP synthase n=1 Tax=Mucilaginibacter agri TaxID=2695265 RepID=A0A965ZHW7_9SPHI|nr:GMP synthase [Mucilaginibacter agri]NCD70407.1 GMP synthase [Mucilaginibacter agri]